MLNASDDSVTPTRPMVDRLGRFTQWIAAVLTATRASPHRVEDAHALRCSLASYSAEDFHDTSIDASDAMGIASWQPALPFFMQNGFDRK